MDKPVFPWHDLYECSIVFDSTYRADEFLPRQDLSGHIRDMPGTAIDFFFVDTAHDHFPIVLDIDLDAKLGNQ
jgi:hypothetical protein